MIEYVSARLEGLVAVDPDAIVTRRIDVCPTSCRSTAAIPIGAEVQAKRRGPRVAIRRGALPAHGETVTLAVPLMPVAS